MNYPKKINLTHQPNESGQCALPDLYVCVLVQHRPLFFEEFLYGLAMQTYPKNKMFLHMASNISDSFMEQQFIDNYQKFDELVKSYR